MLDEPVRALVALSAAVATGDRATLDAAIDRAAEAAPASAAEEVLLQSYLFLGYPAALGALQRWRERTGFPPPVPAVDDWEMWRRRGEAVCARVYGGQYERLRAHIAGLHPDLERWMLAEGYGKVLGRPELDLVTRELCIVALLAGLDAAPQLYAHLRGALNAGAERTEVEEALVLACAGLRPERAAAARAVWVRVCSQREPPLQGT